MLNHLSQGPYVGTIAIVLFFVVVTVLASYEQIDVRSESTFLIRHKQQRVLVQQVPLE